jgi:hypothetical protein
MKGIVLDNCSDILIDSNTFEDLDIAIEAKGGKNIHLTRNKIKYSDSRIRQLLGAVDRLNLPDSTKRELSSDIVCAILLGQKGRLDAGKKENLLGKIRGSLGNAAWELAKAVIADVIAGKILIKIANLG